MTDALSGDLKITATGVEFSDKVGSHVTDEQICLLYRTADKLGKIPVDDRYPANPATAAGMETMYGWHRPCRRNEHGVPSEYVTLGIVESGKRLGMWTGNEGK